MKNKIINWIKGLLGITKLKQEVREQEIRIGILTSQVDFLIRENKKFNSLVKVGVDVHVSSRPSHYEHSQHGSWAIVAIEGQKEDFIQFVSLAGEDIREIQRFLKQFDRGSRVIDAPIGMKKHLLWY